MKEKEMYPPLLDKPQEERPSQPQVQAQIPNFIYFGPKSQHSYCPHCHANIKTSTTSKSTIKTHLFAFLLCITGVCTLCACTPYCCASCKNIDHYCPNCTSYLGSYKN